MAYQPTTATKRIFNLRKRIRAIAGGTAASKTISILIWLIDYSQSVSGDLCTVVSESYPHLEKGAMRDFENIMKAQGYWKDSRWNKTKHCYEFETGTQIEFMSVDTYGKAHGPRRDVLFLNECNNLDYNIADQLITRTRKIVWMDWNPSSEFWFYTEMLNKRDDVDFITLTYLDNEALDQTTIHEIESHKDNKNWWKVYGEGQLGEVEGRIYTGWKVIDNVPFNAKIERYGLDFGYSVDPTVIEAIYSYDGGYIIDEVLYQKEMSNKSIADILLGRDRAIVVADNSEPKSIDEIASHGVPVIACVKGQGSVNRGINYVQDQKISITSRSTKTLKAYRNYMWATDKNGKSLQEPDDKVHEWSNPMDAIRYGIESTKPIHEEIILPEYTPTFSKCGY